MVVESWSNCQATIALSATKTAAELIAMQSMMKDLDWDVRAQLYVDATIAQAMANRQGIGRERNLEVKHLWF